MKKVKNKRLALNKKYVANLKSMEFIRGGSGECPIETEQDYITLEYGSCQTIYEDYCKPTVDPGVLTKKSGVKCARGTR